MSMNIFQARFSLGISEDLAGSRLHVGDSRPDTFDHLGSTQWMVGEHDGLTVPRNFLGCPGPGQRLTSAST